jgi:hypothetical protein
MTDVPAELWGGVSVSASTPSDELEAATEALAREFCLTSHEGRCQNEQVCGYHRNLARRHVAAIARAARVQALNEAARRISKADNDYTETQGMQTAKRIIRALAAEQSEAVPGE